MIVYFDPSFAVSESMFVPCTLQKPDVAGWKKSAYAGRAPTTNDALYGTALHVVDGKDNNAESHEDRATVATSVTAQKKLPALKDETTIAVTAELSIRKPATATTPAAAVATVTTYPGWICPSASGTTPLRRGATDMLSLEAGTRQPLGAVDGGPIHGQPSSNEEVEQRVEEEEEEEDSGGQKVGKGSGQETDGEDHDEEGGKTAGAR